MLYLKLNTNIPPIYAKSIEEFNSYVDKYKTENEIILTKGNNISQANLRNLPCSKTWKRANHLEFQYIDGVYVKPYAYKENSISEHQTYALGIKSAAIVIASNEFLRKSFVDGKLKYVEYINVKHSLAFCRAVFAF